MVNLGTQLGKVFLRVARRARAGQTLLHTAAFLQLLRREEPTPQFVELTDTARLHVVQLAKPRKENSASVSSVQCAADLEAEIYGALEVNKPAHRDRTHMFLTRLCPHGVPHMRHGHLIHISPDIPTTELAMQVRTGGRPPVLEAC